MFLLNDGNMLKNTLLEVKNVLEFNTVFQLNEIGLRFFFYIYIYKPLST